PEGGAARPGAPHPLRRGETTGDPEGGRGGGGARSRAPARGHRDHAGRGDLLPLTRSARGARRGAGRGPGLPLAVLPTLLPGCGSDGNTPTDGASPSPPPAARDWPMYGHDPHRTGYNAGETTISAANVGQLAPRFQASVGTGDFASSSGPVVAN